MRPDQPCQPLPHALRSPIPSFRPLYGDGAMTACRKAAASATLVATPRIDALSVGYGVTGLRSREVEIHYASGVSADPHTAE